MARSSIPIIHHSVTAAASTIGAPERANRSRAASLLGFAGRRFNPDTSVGIWRQQRSGTAGVDTAASVCAYIALYAHRSAGAVTKYCHTGHFRHS